MVNEQSISAKKNIFISYRVHDAAGEAGRLADSLKEYFSEDQIFMDIDKLGPGEDFADTISKSLESCDIMLAIIGADWSGYNAITHESRINQPQDWVKVEISKALERKIRVVPILVNGATLPEASKLPADLQPLLAKQSYELSNKRWKYDVAELVKFLIKFGIAPKKNPVHHNSDNHGKIAIKPTVLIAIISIVLIIAFVVYYVNRTPPQFYAKHKGAYPQTDSRLMDSAEVRKLDKKDLKIMRNEIYARHGLIFKTPALREYFTKEDWYKPLYKDVGDVDQTLNSIELANVKLIYFIEKDTTGVR